MKKVLLTLIASFAFFGGIFAQYQPYWGDADPHYYGYNSELVATLSIDNDTILPDDNYAAYELAAFVKDGENEEFRGHGFLRHYPEYGDIYPIFELTIYCFLDEDPIPVYFKLYDHSTETLYDYCQSSVDVFTHTEYAEYDPELDPHLSFFHTFEKVITPYTTDNGGYYFIASPVEEIMAKDVDNLRSNNFDFYSFDQMPENGSSLEWINHRGEAEYVLQSGMGYLYANSGVEGSNAPVTLIFKGAPYNGNGEVTLEKKEGPTAEFSGWNLIGNPFAQTAYIDRAEYYRMKPDGSEVIPGVGNEIGAMEGIFVIAQNDGETVTFGTTPNGKKRQIVLNVTQDRGNVIDRAIVRFGQGGTLPKFMLNSNNTKMYLTKDGDDFAVVRGNKSGSLPVNFEPAEDGTFVISGLVQNVKNVRYLHLIDNKLGLDIDLLRTPEYEFEAKKTDCADRFVLVFSTSDVFNTMSTKGGDTESFSFCNNGNWIINNEGEAILQVVDVEGRILSSEEINGCVSKRIEAAPGVFMLRLINGKDMKVQKIVVE